MRISSRNLYGNVVFAFQMPTSFHPQMKFARRFAPPAAVALLLAVAPAAQAKVAFGVNVETQNATIASANELNRMGSGGVKAIRVVFDWSLIEPNLNGGMNFSIYDALVNRANSAGVQVLPIFYGTPGWVSGRRGDPPVGDAEITRWLAFVNAAVSRYSTIKAWQVWNEPSLRIAWNKGKPDAEEYAELLIATDKVIDRASNADTILAGMPERTGAGIQLADYLEDLYRVKKVEKHFDAVAVHPFGANEKGVEGGISRIRDVIDDEGDKKKPLWATEVAFASEGPATPFTKGFAGQAKLLTKTFKMLKKKAKKYKIDKAFWFKWRDSDSSPATAPHLNVWPTYTGLFKKAGAPKPAWEAFTQAAGGNAGNGNVIP